ncbi:MAG: hypothetical protein IPK21_04100 [Haliscomenobacter sp.]|nr:hypothetical protein [Haliscomenobacter sp.]
MDGGRWTDGRWTVDGWTVDGRRETGRRGDRRRETGVEAAEFGLCPFGARESGGFFP